jgi:hypothetical protein
MISLEGFDFWQIDAHERSKSISSTLVISIYQFKL